MTELAIPEQNAVAVRAELPVPAANDIDSWTRIVGQVVSLANEIYDTPFVPDGLRGSSAAVSAAILAGREMGLGPMTSLQHIHVVKGKPGQSALLMRALIISAGHKWEDVDISDTRVVVKGCRKGESVWAEASFTADQAKRAGITLGGYPQDKLYARATVRLARRKFADVIMGMPYSAEELEDGFDGETAPASIATTQAPAIEPAKPRTARRRTATKDPSPASTPHAPAAAPAPQGAGEALPPLPGEEEITAPVSGDEARAAQAAKAGSSGPGAADPDDTDRDTPGTVTTPQLTRIWATLTSDLGFGSDDAEKERAREVCATIARRDLESSKDLSFNEARAVIDTLSQVGNRDDLMQLLDAVEQEAN